MSTFSTQISCESFLEAGFLGQWSRALVAGFPGDPENPVDANWTAYPAKMLPDLSRQRELNLYFCPSLVRATRRVVHEFESFHVLVFDDVGTKLDLDAIKKHLWVSPNYLIETSPGNYQAGWFVEPQKDLGRVKAVLQKLRDRLGAGDNLTDPMVWRRLPIGINGKAKYRGQNGTPWPVETTLNTRVPLLWSEIEHQLGGVTSVPVQLTGPGAMPDPLEIEADVVLQAFRLLGRVLGLGRSMTMGWGFDVECPWSRDHTDREQEGAAYIPVQERFHCHHGHCNQHTMGEVRERLNELLLEESGGVQSLAALEFDEVDPKTVLVPYMRALVPGGAIDLWDQKTSPAWPGGVLPAVLEDTLAELALRDGLDLGALGATTITVASGAADKRSTLTPYAGSQWWVRPVLWLMLIAEPGQRKTAVLAYLLGLLRKRNAERMRAYTQAMANWRLLPAAQRKQQPGPAVRALLAEDTTIEKLQEWMAENPRGLLYMRDELASLFEFGRYTTGTGAAERANFLEFYEGGPTTIGRMTRTTSIDNCALSIIGGIQPHKLAEFKGLGDDGLLPRFGTLLMQRVGSGIRKNIPPDISTIDATIERLLLLGADNYRTDPAGEDIIRDIETLGESLAQRPDIGVGYRGFFNKLHGTHARAALVLHLMDGGQDQVVPADTIMRAARYTVFLLDHAEIFYSGLEGSAEHTARAIGSYILRHPTERVTAGRIRSDVAACRRLCTLKEIQDALFLLVLGGWLLPETNYPSNNAWRVRPGLQDQFAARTASETFRVESVKQAMNQHGRYR